MDTDNKIENNKYYTPEIEEFCVGFEVEVNHKRRDGSGNRGWCKEKFRMSQENVRFTKYLLENEPDNIRTKQLDKEDIVENNFIVEYNPSEYKCYFKTEDDKYGITLRSNFYDGGFSNVHIYELKVEGLGTIFSGKIKNKTEFKKLLKMLDININI